MVPRGDLPLHRTVGWRPAQTDTCHMGCEGDALQVQPREGQLEVQENEEKYDMVLARGEGAPLRRTFQAGQQVLRTSWPMNL